MKKILLIILIFSLIFIIGCQETQVKEDVVESAPGRLLKDNVNSADLEVEVKDWKDVKLFDVVSGESFTVNDFMGKTVLMESFAVWCPTCTRQQKNIHDLQKEMVEIVSISLDTDPNEDEAIVKSHVNANGFTGKYAVAPMEVSRALIDEFGVGVVNAPSAPVVLICKDGNSRLMDRGLKSVSELKEEIAKGC